MRSAVRVSVITLIDQYVAKGWLLPEYREDAIAALDREMRRGSRRFARNSLQAMEDSIAAASIAAALAASPDDNEELMMA